MTEAAVRDLADENVAALRKALTATRTLALAATLVAASLLRGFDLGSGLFATVVVVVAGLAALASVVVWVMSERSVRTQLHEMEAPREVLGAGA